MKRRFGRIVVCLAATAFAITPLLSQTQPVQKPSFEVASVKSSQTRGRGRMTADGGRFTATNENLRTLLRWAYRPPAGGPIFYNQYQIIGAPDWMDTDRFAVEAKVEGDSRQVPAEEMQLMVQSLLEDRFHLKVRQETRQLPVYDLVVAKGGLKLNLSEDQTPPDRQQAQQQGQRGQRGQGGANGAAPVRGRTYASFNTSPSGGFNVTLTGAAISIPVLVNRLQEIADRPIVDKTALDGLFDIKLQFNVDAGPGGGEPEDADAFRAILTALPEQLGLKLESSKAPNSVLVIDSVQKPAEN